MQYIIQNAQLDCCQITNSNMTSFFCFVNNRASYPLGIISLTHVPTFPLTAYIVTRMMPIEGALLFELHILCATFFASVNINYRLPIKVYILSYQNSQTYQNRNKSWKPECFLSFNMDWRILVNFTPRFWLGIKY